MDKVLLIDTSGRRCRFKGE